MESFKIAVVAHESPVRSTKKNLDKLEHEIISIIWARGEVANFDEEVRREVAHSQARMLNRLGWAFD